MPRHAAARQLFRMPPPAAISLSPDAAPRRHASVLPRRRFAADASHFRRHCFRLIFDAATSAALRLCCYAPLSLYAAARCRRRLRYAIAAAAAAFDFRHCLSLMSYFAAYGFCRLRTPPADDDCRFTPQSSYIIRYRRSRDYRCQAGGLIISNIRCRGHLLQILPLNTET